MSPEGLAPLAFEVAPEEGGERLDRVVAARGADRPGWSRAAVQRWVEDGRVAVDGRPAGRSARLRAGQRVEVRPAPPPPTEARPEDIPLDVLFEDTHLLVVDKPPGLVVHPAAGHAEGTLVNAVLHHTRLERTEADDPARPGIVHRLDKDTSGVLVVAKSVAAREGLVRLFQAHDLERRYLAIALGAVAPVRFTLDTPHGRHPSDRKRFSTRVERGRRAVTHVEVLERLDEATLLACTLETGRTHQIRVHLADRGHPLLGDALYGRAPRTPVARAAAAALGRQALHAALLAFAHPVTGAPLRFETAPPADFQAALARLRPPA